MDLIHLVKSVKAAPPNPKPFTPGDDIVDDIVTLKGAEILFFNIITVIIAFAGIVFFVMLLVGGFRFITSGGDPKGVEAAQGTLTSAVGGLVIVVLALLILKFIETITGAPVTNFRVYIP